MTPRPSAVVSYLQDVVLAKHIHAIVLSAARYFPSFLPYHAWFMWTFREQPGPVRWREFFAGVWARFSGSATGGPWPRISELDQDATKDKCAELADSDGDSLSSVGETAISNLPFRPVNPNSLPSIDATLEKVADASEHGKLEQPADVLTPPYTPATQSPTGASAPVRPDSPSSEIDMPGSVLVEEEEKHKADSVGRRAKAANLLWPILEEEPTYRVDWGVNIFNYDCGLYVTLRPRASGFIPIADNPQPTARNIPTSPAFRTKRLALRSTSCTVGIPTSSPSLDTPSARTSPSRSDTRLRMRRGLVRPARDRDATSERSSTGQSFAAEVAPVPERFADGNLSYRAGLLIFPCPTATTLPVSHRSCSPSSPANRTGRKPTL